MIRTIVTLLLVIVLTTIPFLNKTHGMGALFLFFSLAAIHIYLEKKYFFAKRRRGM